MSSISKFVAIIGAAGVIAAACVSPYVPEDDPETEAPEQQQEDEEAVAEPQQEEPQEEIGEAYAAEAQPQMDEPADQEDDVAALIERAAEGDHRSEDNIARNEYRNPVETLEFFGFDPSMNVVEIWPGAGWYTEVLAPVLAEGEGSLYAGIFEMSDDPEDYRTRITIEYLQLLEDNEDVFGQISYGIFDPPQTVQLGDAGSAQMVVTFRNLHNLHQQGLLDDAIEAYFEVLEPGGVLGVVQHRAPEGSDPDETAEDGYLPEQFVIETVEAAGFEFEESSEINANPDDTADHEEGVWSLPPTLRGGEEDAEYYKEIGESDRMTLRFVRADDPQQEAGDDVADDAEGDDEPRRRR